MATILIEHPVADFAAWRKAFDADPLRRAKHGVVAHRILRAADGERTLVVITLDFATRGEAEVFLPMLEGMWRAVGEELGFEGPGVRARILDEVERSPA